MELSVFQRMHVFQGIQWKQFGALIYLGKQLFSPHMAIVTRQDE